jgi:hypothetical protein
MTSFRQIEFRQIEFRQIEFRQIEFRQIEANRRNASKAPAPLLKKINSAHVAMHSATASPPRR